jgi:hypothetical protein
MIKLLTTIKPEALHKQAALGGAAADTSNGFCNSIGLELVEPLVTWARTNKYVVVEPFALAFHGHLGVPAHTDTLMRAATTQLCWAIMGTAELYDEQGAHQWRSGQVLAFDSRIQHGVRARRPWRCFVLDVFDRNCARRWNANVPTQ